MESSKSKVISSDTSLVSVGVPTPSSKRAASASLKDLIIKFSMA